MGNMLQNARRAALLQQEMYHKRQADKTPKSRAKSHRPKNRKRRRERELSG